MYVFMYIPYLLLVRFGFPLKKKALHELHIRYNEETFAQFDLTS